MGRACAAHYTAIGSAEFERQEPVANEMRPSVVSPRSHLVNCCL